VAKNGYYITTEGAIATGTSLKYILGVKSGATTANHGVDLIGYTIAFDGTTAGATPVLVEICACTFATNGPGTNSTSVTVRQAYGRAAGTGFSAAANWTSAPTVVTVIKQFYLTPNGGTIVYDWPLGTSPDSPLGEGFVIRVTADASVNVTASMRFERC
jgi:hypothetical protein